jgi:alpha-N-acetylglucosaminidase
MTPVLQGFTGHVPAAVAKLFPDAKLHHIRWIEWETCLLDPLDPLFPKIAKMFLEEQTARFGTDHLYAADTFIEMTPPNGELKYLTDLSRAIYDGMAKSDPEAVWVLQGWAFMFGKKFWTQPRIEAFLDAIPDERMAILDLFCESTPMWQATESFCGKPWLWCNVQTFGRAVLLGGPLDRNNRGLFDARRDPQSGRLVGLGFVNEGLCYNPVVYDLMFEAAWRSEPVELNDWIAGYAKHRYGRPNDDAQRAWQILLETAYDAPHRSGTVIERTPSLKRGIAGASYDVDRLADAWRCLLRASEQLGDVDTLRFDLVNVAREVLVGHAADLHHELAAAWEAKDAEKFEQASQRFLQLLREVDELLATRQEFLLGCWLEDAKRWGKTDPERARFEWNARRVLTLWGEGPAIDDYARKQWSGMIAGYYLQRWQPYLEAAAASLKNGKPFDEAEFGRKLRTWMAAWSDARETYPTEPRGDSVAVARRLLEKYAAAFQPEATSLTTGKPATCSHALPPYPAHLANDGRSRNPDRFWATDVAQHPEAWWQVDLGEPTAVGRVVVVAYYGDERRYGFTVEASLDGKTWEMVADQRENKEPSTREGYTCRFKPRPVRYLRVTMPTNSANTGRHLVEVMAFAE